MLETLIRTAAPEANVRPERLEVLDRFLRRLNEQDGYDFVSVYATRHGVPVYSGAYGIIAPGVKAADGTTSSGEKLTMDAIFPLQSITKPIIATLIAMLQEDGVIDFYERFNQYYPEFTGEKKDQVLLWHLLSHSSGMSGEAMDAHIMDYIRDKCGKGADDPISDEDYGKALLMAREEFNLPKELSDDQASDLAQQLVCLKAPLAFDPGTAFNYCNYAYELLKQLVERLTGEDIDTYATRVLFRPLGMHDTHFIVPEHKRARIVKRAAHYQGGQWLNGDWVATSTSGAGGLKSTMPDMTRFGQMWLQEGTLDGVRILSPASVRLMTRNHNAGLPDSMWGGRWLSSAWGLGWNVCYGKKDDLGFLRSLRTFDHAGAGGARLLIDPETGLVASYYIVEKGEMTYDHQSRVANILYSALD
jgi:CubicO group peptidase (beta-lactamase class C family)